MNRRRAPTPPFYVKQPDGTWITEADMDETSNDSEVIIDVEEPGPEDEPEEPEDDAAD